MKSCDGMVSMDKQESQIPTLSATPAMDFTKITVQSSEWLDSNENEISTKVVARQSRVMRRATRGPIRSAYRELDRSTKPRGCLASRACRSMHRGRDKGRGRGGLPVQGRIAPQVVFLVPISTSPLHGVGVVKLRYLVCGLNLPTKMARFMFAKDECFAEWSVSNDGPQVATASCDKGFNTILALLCQFIVGEKGSAE